jgi:hypothetical protein
MPADEFIAKNKEKIRTQFNWEKITDSYEKAFLKAL